MVSKLLMATAVLGLIGCGSDSAPPSVNPNTTIAELNDSEATATCEWVGSNLSGLECEGRAVYDDSLEDCLDFQEDSAGTACGDVKFSDFQRCVLTFVEDPCLESSSSQLACAAAEPCADQS